MRTTASRFVAELALMCVPGASASGALLRPRIKLSRERGAEEKSAPRLRPIYDKRGDSITYRSDAR